MSDDARDGREEEQTRHEYTCAECGGVFEYGWTDEEAEQESINNWGVSGHTPGMAVVCDDCYQGIMRRIGRTP